MEAATVTSRRRASRPAASRVIPLGNAVGTAPPQWDVPGDGIYELQAVTFTLTTAAGGAARSIVVQYGDETGTIAAVASSPFTLAAAKTSVFSFTVGGQQFGANDAPFIGGPLPPLLLTSHFTVFVVEVNGAAGDAFAAPRLIVREHPLDLQE